MNLQQHFHEITLSRNDIINEIKSSNYNHNHEILCVLNFIGIKTECHGEKLTIFADIQIRNS